MPRPYRAPTGLCNAVGFNFSRLTVVGDGSGLDEPEGGGLLGRLKHKSVSVRGLRAYCDYDQQQVWCSANSSQAQLRAVIRRAASFRWSPRLAAMPLRAYANARTARRRDMQRREARAGRGAIG